MYIVVDYDNYLWKVNVIKGSQIHVHYTVHIHSYDEQMIEQLILNSYLFFNLTYITFIKRTLLLLIERRNY